MLSSDIPENNFFLDLGKNGFLCSTTEEFRKRIIEIKEMTDSRYAALSASARDSVDNFDLENFCDGLLSAYEKITPK